MAKKINSKRNLGENTFFKGQKISKAIYKFMVSLILPKNERKYEKIRHNSTMIPQVDFFCSFFWRIEDTIICFRDLLTFSENPNLPKHFVFFILYFVYQFNSVHFQ